MYPVRIQRHVVGVCAGEPVGYSLEYCTALPFAPTPQIGLGLYPDCDFFTDHYRVKRVMWLTESREFLVEIEECRYEDNAHDVLVWLFAHGWRVLLAIQCDTREEACSQLAEDGDSDYRVVGARGGWYQVDTDALHALRLSGESFELIEPPYAGAKE